VVCVDNGAAAIDVAATTDFDVILMDVRMAGMNGLEATRRIRALPAPRGRVRVVAVTAQAFSQQIELCRQAGMDGHVSKPFKQSVLLAALETPSAAAMRADPALPLLDRSLFEEIATTLSAAELAENLRILITRAETLLPDLCGDGVQPPAGELAEAAHKLAGGAGTFGFMAVAAAARQFEASADSNASDTAARATHLAATITASMTIIREQLVAVTAQAA
jgi:CheY-like chemotaxis protein